MYRRINRTGKGAQDLLFFLPNEFKMQQEHKSRDAVFSSASYTPEHKAAYISQTILPLSSQLQ